MYLSVCLKTYACALLAFLVASESEKDVRTPGTGVTDASESPCWSWQLNSGPLKGQKVFLNTESSI